MVSPRRVDRACSAGSRSVGAGARLGWVVVNGRRVRCV